MRLGRALVRGLAKLATPIVEEATLRIHRRRGMEAKALGIGGIFNGPFYRLFGPNLTFEDSADLGGEGAEHSPHAPEPQLCPPDPQPSAEVVQFDRRSAF